MKRQTGYNILILIVVLLIGLSICWSMFRWDNKYTSALPGGYGYSVLQKDTDKIAFLVDGWEYYPGQLLNPEDFAGGVSPESYTYIGQYPNFSSDLGSPYGTATYRLILKNDGGQEKISLYLPELLCAGRVFIDGELAGEQGSVSPYSPEVTDAVYSFEADENTEIIVQCANYTHYYSGMYYPPAVGSPKAVFQMTVLRMIVYGFLCFVSLTVALVNLSQWLRSRDRPTRWMGLLCLAYALWVSYPFFRALGAPSVRPLYALEDFFSSGVLLCAILLAGRTVGCVGTLVSPENRRTSRHGSVRCSRVISCGYSTIRTDSHQSLREPALCMEAGHRRLSFLPGGLYAQIYKAAGTLSPVRSRSVWTISGLFRSDGKQF